MSLWLLAPVLTPFLIGAILAYALHPAVEALARRGVGRTLAVLAVESAAVLGIAGVALLIVPVVLQELPLIQQKIPALAQRFNDVVAPWLSRLGISVSLDVAGIKAIAMRLLSANAQEGMGALLSSLRIGGSVLLALVGNAILVPVVLFYLLMDWPRLVERARALVPERLAPEVESFTQECDHLLGQYLRGQCLVMLALAAFYAAALGLAGLDLALPLGVFTGLATFVPYLGFGLGLVLSLLAAVLQFPGLTGVLAVAVVFSIGQLLESFLLTPRLVGQRIGLNPLAVIFALLAFGHLFGFVGVLVALPASAVLLVALRRLKALYLASRLYRS